MASVVRSTVATHFRWKFTILKLPNRFSTLLCRIARMKLECRLIGIKLRLSVALRREYQALLIKTFESWICSYQFSSLALSKRTLKTFVKVICRIWEMTASTKATKVLTTKGLTKSNYASIAHIPIATMRPNDRHSLVLWETWNSHIKIIRCDRGFVFYYVPSVVANATNTSESYSS